jgi:hypothetical protein
LSSPLLLINPLYEYSALSSSKEKGGTRIFEEFLSKRKHFIFQKILVHLFSLFFSSSQQQKLSHFFLSLSLLYSACYVFCGVSSITDDDELLLFVKKKVFYTTYIRKRERDGRGL